MSCVYEPRWTQQFAREHLPWCSHSRAAFRHRSLSKHRQGFKGRLRNKTRLDGCESGDARICHPTTGQRSKVLNETELNQQVTNYYYYYDCLMKDIKMQPRDFRVCSVTSCRRLWSGPSTGPSLFCATTARVT